MPFSRRELMRRFGLTLGSVPLLDAFGRSAAWADSTSPAKRLVCIYIPHGVFAQHWLPFVPRGRPISSESPGNGLKPANQFLKEVAFEQRTGCVAIDLAPFTGALSPVHSAKWQSFRTKTAFMSNFGCSNATVQGHTSSGAFAGHKNPNYADGDPRGPFNYSGESIDTVIARKLGQKPLVLRAPDSIDDARFAESAWSPSIRKSANGSSFEMAPSQINAIQTWDKLFSTYVPPTAGPKVRDPGVRRQALLERTLQSLSKIKKDQRLSTYDAQRIDNHAGIIESQRSSLAAMTGLPVAALAAPPQKIPGNPGESVEKFNIAKGALVRGQLANASAALKMGKYQVITIDMGLENEWLTEGINLGGSQAYHGNAGHLANPSDAIIEEIRKTQQLVYDSIAGFIADLDTLEDPASGATYLDNTLVMVAPEHDGRPNGHLRAAVPVIFAGGIGSFTRGKVLDYASVQMATADRDAVYQGVSYSRLLLSVLGFYAVTQAERSTMDIQGVTQSWQGADMTDWNQPLTGMT